MGLRVRNLQEQERPRVLNHTQRRSKRSRTHDRGGGRGVGWNPGVQMTIMSSSGLRKELGLMCGVFRRISLASGREQKSQSHARARKAVTILALRKENKLANIEKYESKQLTSGSQAAVVKCTRRENTRTVWWCVVGFTLKCLRISTKTRVSISLVSGAVTLCSYNSGSM